ncbi:hypothetical protein ACFL35_19165 [Candidatus Riflebacteria bacterium]
MPEISGYEFLQQILKKKELDGLPILIISSLAQVFLDNDPLPHNVFNLKKPYKRGKLISVVNKMNKYLQDLSRGNPLWLPGFFLQFIDRTGTGACTLSELLYKKKVCIKNYYDLIFHENTFRFKRLRLCISLIQILRLVTRDLHDFFKKTFFIYCSDTYSQLNVSSC